MTIDKTPPAISRSQALDAVCSHKTHAQAAVSLGITGPELRSILLNFAAAKPKAKKTSELQSQIERLTANVALQESMISRLIAAKKPEKAKASVKKLADEDEEYEERIFGVENVRVRRVLEKPSSRHIRVLVIGDSHFHPGLPQTERLMTLVGHHAAATRPEHIVHIGDGSDWNSVCRHTKNDTWKARKKPSIGQDIACFERNWTALNAPMDAAGVSTSRHYCMGNHDAWLWTFEDSQPEIKGMATDRFTGILKDSGWSFTDYGEFAFIGGVGFVHVPLNLMGKPFGGQMPEK